jgi:hypothetical protein
MKRLALSKASLNGLSFKPKNFAIMEHPRTARGLDATTRLGVKMPQPAEDVNAAGRPGLDRLA